MSENYNENNQENFIEEDGSYHFVPTKTIIEEEKTITPIEATIVEKKSRSGLKTLGLIFLALLTIGASVFGSYFATQKAISEGKDRVVVYEGVQTNTVNLSTTDLSPVVAEIENTVVEVYTESVKYSNFYGEYITSGAGSGVIYSKDGYIITNNHVINGAKNINVKLHDGRDYQAVLIATDPETDIAVIKIDAEDLDAAILGQSANLKVGEMVIAIGNPLGTLGGTVTTGIISALSREITIDGQKMTLLQTNTAINPGNSGGGLFNTSGELIAIVNAKSSGDDVEGIGFAIPIDIAKQVAQELILNGYVAGRPIIGISCTSVDNERIMRYYNLSRYGVYINEVTLNTAKKAGLQSGDLIIGIEGSNVESLDQLSDALSKFKAGDNVNITVLRGEQQLEFKVLLSEKNNQ